MDNKLAVPDKTSIIENVLMAGDLSKLSAAERISYYKSVCESIGLNPLTRPFDYITLSGRLTLYAKKDATEQLRDKRGVSIDELETSTINEVYIVTAHASCNGRKDIATGAVFIGGKKGDDLANAIMKAETKAKRRVTLSICGLGFLDETEVETIRDATPAQVTDTGEIVDVPAQIPGLVSPPPIVPPERPGLKAWQEWDILCTQADNVGAKVPKLNADTITLDELRQAYKELQARIKLFDHAKALDQEAEALS